jgi:hypothetical protein
MRAGWRILIHREGEELALGKPSERARGFGIQKSYDGPKHPVRGKGIAPVNPEDPCAGEMEHYASIDMGVNLGQVPQAKSLEPLGQVLLHSESPVV